MGILKQLRRRAVRTIAEELVRQEESDGWGDQAAIDRELRLLDKAKEMLVQLAQDVVGTGELSQQALLKLVQAKFRFSRIKLHDFIFSADELDEYILGARTEAVAEIGGWKVGLVTVNDKKVALVIY